jgi:hypothetical protein
MTKEFAVNQLLVAILRADAPLCSAWFLEKPVARGKGCGYRAAAQRKGSHIG